MRDCDIRGREDDLDCRPDGDKREKAWMLAGDIFGLGVVFCIYNFVNN